ncbi:MAG: SpoIIE family protein phosphatase [Treponema sp.]|jgi:serine phosphatase RsbU (regulator of sigma subunit)|nr:SpoIIE family protein phosphatase [Treponema sp.]
MQIGTAVSPALVLAALLAVLSLLVLCAAVYAVAAAFAGNKKNAPAAKDAYCRPKSCRQGRWQGRRGGRGLRYKLALFAITLVMLVIFMVSIPLRQIMIREQQKTLLQSLWKCSSVLLESMAASLRLYIITGNIAELALLPARIASIPEARYLTISGCTSEFEYEDRVWASNDPGILMKIDTPNLEPGVSRIKEPMQWHGTDTRIVSEPEYVFNYMPGNSLFVFTKPVVFWNAAQNGYFRGLLRMEVSIDSIIAEMEMEQALLERAILVIALAALISGIVGALILSSLIIRPIHKLVRHVQIIRDTRDKRSLAGMEIQINSRDEIAVLGSTVNEMTQKLAMAAATESELSVGREIQKKFLPLELDNDGNMLSSGLTETETAVFFGYYAGAKVISGDYFDYHDLDGRHYAIIKCDVAGSGIPAALIMIQVATMFLNYFKGWKPSSEGMRIEKAVYQINDFIETLGFQGRFAAFTLCIFDSQTGSLYFCNAGDNVIHIFDSVEGRVKNIALPQRPAGGVLSNSMVESKGGYRVHSLNLKHGDMLLLYTDGIEESKRRTADSSFEEFGSRRISEIVNAVMSRGDYRLQWGREELHFNFSRCSGSVEEAVMALVSVEKIFRCYYDPRPAGGRWSPVEKKIDAFLKDHFLQYNKYCDNNAYIYYTHLREEDQYDDLTILGIKRK